MAREAQGSSPSILQAADHPEDFDRHSPMVSRLQHLLIIGISTTAVALRLGSRQPLPMLQESKKNLRLKRHAGPERGPGKPPQAGAADGVTGGSPAGDSDSRPSTP